MARKSQKQSTEFVEKLKTLGFITDKMPAKLVGKKCMQSGIRIPDSKNEYRRLVESRGFYQESPSVLNREI